MISFVLKACQGCGQTLQIGEFAYNKSKSDGFATQCKPCAREITRKWRDKDPERARVLHRAALYGISTQ